MIHQTDRMGVLRMKNFQMTFINSTTTIRWLKLLNFLKRHRTLSNRELSEAVQSYRFLLTHRNHIRSS